MYVGLPRSGMKYFTAPLVFSITQKRGSASRITRYAAVTKSIEGSFPVRHQGMNSLENSSQGGEAQIKSNGPSSQEKSLMSATISGLNPASRSRVVTFHPRFFMAELAPPRPENRSSICNESAIGKPLSGGCVY